MRSPLQFSGIARGSACSTTPPVTNFTLTACFLLQVTAISSCSDTVGGWRPPGPRGSKRMAGGDSSPGGDTTDMHRVVCHYYSPNATALIRPRGTLAEHGLISGTETTSSAPPAPELTYRAGIILLLKAPSPQAESKGNPSSPAPSRCCFPAVLPCLKDLLLFFFLAAGFIVLISLKPNVCFCLAAPR